MKTSITHNKYSIPQFIKDNDPILAKCIIFKPCSFVLLNFLITGLCNSWAKTLIILDPISLVALAFNRVFCQKT